MVQIVGWTLLICSFVTSCALLNYVALGIFVADLIGSIQKLKGYAK